MTAATSIVPFQPAQGLPARDALARAHDYIDKLTRKHEALHKAKEAFVTGARQHGNTFIQSSCTATTAAALGAVNGRFGGEEGLIQRWGVSLDAAVAFVGHVGGFAFSFATTTRVPGSTCWPKSSTRSATPGSRPAFYRFFPQARPRIRGARCRRVRGQRCRQWSEGRDGLHRRASEVTRALLLSDRHHLRVARRVGHLPLSPPQERRSHDPRSSPGLRRAPPPARHVACARPPSPRSP